MSYLPKYTGVLRSQPHNPARLIRRRFPVHAVEDHRPDQLLPRLQPQAQILYSPENKRRISMWAEVVHGVCDLFAPVNVYLVGSLDTSPIKNLAVRQRGKKRC